MERNVAPDHCWCQKTRVFLLPHSEDRMILPSFGSVQYQHVTDGQTALRGYYALSCAVEHKNANFTSTVTFRRRHFETCFEMISTQRDQDETLARFQTKTSRPRLQACHLVNDNDAVWLIFQVPTLAARWRNLCCMHNRFFFGSKN